MQRIPDFVRYVQGQHGTSFDATYAALGQYGRTNGIINELISAQVLADEGISCSPQQILVTVGCQEAMELCVRNLCRAHDDIVLVRSPTYIGITGVADLSGTELAAFSRDDDSILQSFMETVTSVERLGKRPRALYLIPDFDNPTGSVL